MTGKKTMTEKRATTSRRGLRVSLLVYFVAIVFAPFTLQGHAQQSNPMNGPLEGGNRGFAQDNGPLPPGAGDEVDSVEAERRLNALNVERQKSMAADAERLMKLATELNQEIAQSNSGALTPAQQRMVAEIEKLAHNVRDKMAMSLRGPQYPGLDLPPQAFPHH